MAKDLNQEEVLIARNNETGQVGAVTGFNEDGTPKMTDVKSAKLSDLVKFQKGQNPVEAFLSNFVRQCQNPTTFGFFRVPADRYDTVGTAEILVISVSSSITLIQVEQVSERMDKPASAWLVATHTILYNPGVEYAYVNNPLFTTSPVLFSFISS